MASRLNPHITFPGNARQAMEFYKNVFGGTLNLSTFGEYGAADATNAHNIIHGQLETDNGFTLMGADIPPGAELKPGNSITISLSGDDSGELHGYWEKLTDTGTVTIALEKQMWGDEFGRCVDQFDVSWMVNIGTGSQS